MFRRNALNKLIEWSQSQNRKPLVLRGARQVGKTTLVNIFAKQFDNYLYLNLEKPQELKLFKDIVSVDSLLEAIFYVKDKTRKKGKTLIFIDEIQNSSEAVAFLRYFYEDAPELFVISAGSLLETLIDKKINFPVGRVEYLKLHPVSFTEFLEAVNELQSLELLKKEKFPEYGHDKLLLLFHKYTFIGGMPEVVQSYSANRDLKVIEKIYDSLLTAYLDDVEKYARNNTMAQIISHTIEKSFSKAGHRIKFQNFGDSNYRSREVGEAFRTIEKAMILQLIYPVTNTELPININYKKSPRLQVLDTGLLNYFAGLREEIFGTNQLSDIQEGLILEHIVGQELLALNNSPLHKLNFWSREKKDTNSEVDFVYSYKNKLFPIEVKKGKTGRLRSLHEFIYRSPHKYAVRVYSGKLSIDNEKTVHGTEYKLLNLPFYLINRIEYYIDMLIKE
ncbi:MAG: ATP-binding protein [Chlorobi bacterium]|nr:ATP-binding protein [Chlorobiota bacterium]